MEITDITATDLEVEILGSNFIKEYSKKSIKKHENDNYMNIIAVCNRPLFQNLENSLKTEVDLIENDIWLISNEYNSNFIAYEFTLGIYNFKDLSELLFNIFQTEYPGSINVIDIEFVDISMKTKLIVTLSILTIMFDDKSFFSTSLGFSPPWEYKHYNGYTIQKIINLSTAKEKKI